MLNHAQLFICQYHHVLLQSCFQSLHSLGIPDTRVSLTLCVALDPIEPHEFPMDPLLKLVQVPLDGIPSLQLGVKVLPVCKRSFPSDDLLLFPSCG